MWLALLKDSLEERQYHTEEVIRWDNVIDFQSIKKWKSVLTIEKAKEIYPEAKGIDYIYKSLSWAEMDVKVLWYKSYYDEKSWKTLSYALLRSSKSKFAVELKNLEWRLKRRPFLEDFSKVEEEVSSKESSSEVVTLETKTQVSNVIDWLSLFYKKLEQKSESELFKFINWLNKDFFVKICARYEEYTTKLQTSITRVIIRDYISAFYNGSSNIYNFLQYKLKSNKPLSFKEINYLISLNNKNYIERSTSWLEDDKPNISMDWRFKYANSEAA